MVSMLDDGFPDTTQHDSSYLYCYEMYENTCMGSTNLFSNISGVQSQISVRITSCKQKGFI